MQGNEGYAHRRVENLIFFLALYMTHLRTIEHGLRLLDILDLGVGKCVAKEILRQVFYPLANLWF